MRKSNFDAERYAEYYAIAEMMTGTASPQTISYFLRTKSRREQLELEILKEKRELLHEQTEKIRSDRNQEQLYQNAIDAMKKYTGHSDD